MPSLQEKKSPKTLIFLLRVLLFLAIFIFFPQLTEAAQYTAGWYQDVGLVEDTSCEVGYWRAYVEVKDTSGNILQADSLTVTATWYESPSAVGIGIYSTTLANATSVLTDCIDAVRNLSGELVPNYGRMVLTVNATKDSGAIIYYPIIASNSARGAGSTLSQVKWLRSLYLAPLTGDSNLAYVFPVDNQWVNDDTLQMEIFVRKRPASSNITKIKIKADNTNTNQNFFSEVNPYIAEGATTFPAQVYPDGSYLWRVTLMGDDQGFFYNEASYDFFRIDTVKPDFVSPYPRAKADWVISGGEMVTRVNIYSQALDSDNNPGYDIPVSGINEIKIYIENVLKKTCNYPTPLAFQTCSSYFYDQYPVGTYSYYVTVEDHAENIRTSQTKTFTVPPIEPSRLTVYSYIADTNTPGAYMELVSGPAEVGNKNTTYSYTATNIYTFSLKAPEFYQGEPFSFWYGACQTPDFERTSSPGTIYPDTGYSCRAYFGTSVRSIVRRINYGGSPMLPELLSQITQIPTEIEQTGGTPEGLGESNLIGSSWVFSLYINDPILNMVLYAHDSDNGILKFNRWANCDSFPSPRECQQTVNYGRGAYLYAYYDIERTVNVKSYVDGVSTPGVAIGKISGLIPASTTDYTFKSTSTASGFNTTLRAPLVYNIAAEDKIFDYWEGCDDMAGAMAEDCIMKEGGWYYTISRTIIAHYGVLPSPPTDDPIKRGELKVQPAGSPIPITVPLHNTTDPNLYFIKQGITAEGPLRVGDKNGNIKAIDLLPINDLNASPFRIKTLYATDTLSVSEENGIWSIRKWQE